MWKRGVLRIFGPRSGKTSLLRMLACLSPFNVGDIYIKGLNLKMIRSNQEFSWICPK